MSALMAVVTITHATEDFHNGIHLRFGLDLLPAAFGLALVYGVQVLATAGAARGARLGFAASAALAAIWLVGAIVDHVPDLLPPGPWRTGLPSEALAVAVMAVAAAWLAVSLLALRSASVGSRTRPSP